MANSKISALTAATTPLAGTEVLPVVQSGVTKQVSVANLTAGRSVAVLDLTSTNDSLVNGITIGRGAGSVSTSTVLGNGAFITNVSGAENTAIGYQTLRLNTQGYNTAIGSLAGSVNSTGGITAVGARALQNNTTGVGNVAVGGYDATTTYQAALRSNQTGNYNTAMGNGSLTGVTASNNTGYGFMSGYNLTTGTNGIYIGYFATASAASAANEIVIGASATGNGSNTVTLGNSSHTAIYPGANANYVPGAAKGINFTANTGAAGMTSQLLNWYEEGTWTPSIGSSGTAPTIGYTIQVGNYTRIGRMVYFSAEIVTSSATGGTGALRLTGLPFTAGSSRYVGGLEATYSSGWTTQAPQIGSVYQGTTYADLGYNGTTGTNQSTVSHLTNGAMTLIAVGWFTV